MKVAKLKGHVRSEQPKLSSSSAAAQRGTCSLPARHYLIGEVVDPLSPDAVQVGAGHGVYVEVAHRGNLSFVTVGAGRDRRAYKVRSGLNVRIAATGPHTSNRSGVG
ncbi:MAG: hypothetical protein ACYCST_12980 [Acidimicrobiales bacterium]